MPATPTIAQDKAAIQSLNDKFARFFNARDSAAVAALYTEDAITLPPGSDMARGRSVIQSFWNAAVQPFGDAKLTALEMTRLGGTAAREIGTFSFRSKGQQPQEITGKYVVVWEKVGDDWELATDIWDISK